MAFSLSPSVAFKETDLTAIVPAVATSIGAFAGEFEWGPALQATQISNENALLATFGRPTNNTFSSFFSAANYLGYSSNLMVVRAATASMKNAVTSGTAVLIKNQNDYDFNYASGQGTVGMVAAKYPGTKGNSLKVSMCDAANFSKTLVGTVAVASGSAVMTGTGTAFDTALVVGDFITVTVSAVTYTKQVVSIASATSVTLDSTFPAAGSGLTATAGWEYASYFPKAPVDSSQAIAANATGDGLHIVVIDVGGQFTGTYNSVLEKFENVSKSASGKQYDGTSGYYKTVLNSSAYVYWMDHPDSTNDLAATGLDWGTFASPGAYKNLKHNMRCVMTGGVDSYGATTGELQTAFALFSNSESMDISLLFTGAVNADVARYAIQNVAEARMDCVAFVSPVNTADTSVIIGDTSASTAAVLNYRNTLNVNSSYGFMDTGYKYQYDRYNDVYRWIPLNADIAGLCARTDYTNEPWYSPAGLNRGQIKNVTKLAFNPDKTARDTLFSQNINPVVSFPGQGTVLFGDKTLLTRPSAFDAINVRRLFIVLEKAIATASKYFLFELNTDLTRQLFSATINPYLRDIQGRQGITDFLVDVGPTVNTAQVIDGNELRGNIFIKPVRSIRFVTLNFIATRNGVSFSEITI